MKNLMLTLNAIALIAVLGACSTKTEIKDTGNGSLFAPGTGDELQISLSPGDGKYNSVELSNANVNEVEKTFTYSPADDMKIELGSSGVSGIDCNMGSIDTLLELQRFDTAGAVVSTTRLDYFTPALLLEKGAKYGVHAKLTGTRGCRSVFLSFTINKAP